MKDNLTELIRFFITHPNEIFRSGLALISSSLIFYILYYVKGNKAFLMLVFITIILGILLSVYALIKHIKETN